MRILVTAGNTQTPIDDVRVITNVFSGRTGGLIAAAARDRGHAVTLLTSHPDLVLRPAEAADKLTPAWLVCPYRTFDDLQQLMEQHIRTGQFDAVIHSAAVSDYQLAGTYVPAPETHFEPADGSWQIQPASGESSQSPPTLLDVTAGKVKSNHRELWMRMIPTRKLVDLIRQPWGFNGVLVKFKLEVGPTDDELIQIAEASRRHSHADLMVANTLSGMKQTAFLGPINGGYERLERSDLPRRLLEEVEKGGKR